MSKPIPQEDSILPHCKKTSRTHRILIQNRPRDFDVYEIPVKHLYFNIANGRYADRMMRIMADNPGVEIRLQDRKWRDEVREILMGRGPRADPHDKAAAQRLLSDIDEKQQITPGVVSMDGGVLDGNRRLAVLMELGVEQFDGVILPQDVPEEDIWRIEAGLQLGKALQHDYSPVNELLKIRDGIELFKRLKNSDHDPAPGKTAEELVAEALYGVSPTEVKENIARIQLIDEYLEWAGIKNRYDLVGDTAERFKEALKVIDAARNRNRSKEEILQLKAWLFHQIISEHLDNWELRKVYSALGGDPRRRGRRITGLEKSGAHLWDNMPEAKELKKVTAKMAAAKRDKQDPIKAITDAGLAATHQQSVGFANELLELVGEEEKEAEPLRLLGEAKTRLSQASRAKKQLGSKEKKEMARAELAGIIKTANEFHQEL